MSKAVVRLTKAQKRVAIARDVIKQINIGHFIASSGIYCIATRSILKDENGVIDPNHKEWVASLQNCNVCAVGSMFLSYINKYNNVDTGLLEKVFTDYNYVKVESNDIKCYDTLTKIFSREQLTLIECTFEGWENKHSEDIVHKMRKFRHKYQDTFGRILYNTDRLLKDIMRNIIKNGGTFKL